MLSLLSASTASCVAELLPCCCCPAVAAMQRCEASKSRSGTTCTLHINQPRPHARGGMQLAQAFRPPTQPPKLHGKSSTSASDQHPALHVPAGTQQHCCACAASLMPTTTLQAHRTNGEHRVVAPLPRRGMAIPVQQDIFVLKHCARGQLQGEVPPVPRRPLQLWAAGQGPSTCRGR